MWPSGRGQLAVAQSSAGSVSGPGWRAAEAVEEEGHGVFCAESEQVGREFDGVTSGNIHMDIVLPVNGQRPIT